MTRTAYATDYVPAIPYWADDSNYYKDANTPKGFVLHTPEEPADDHPGTAIYFASPNRQASTHYFAAYTGKVYQCVPERYMAIANGVIGKPYPRWADPSRSLNRQSLSVEIEGYGASIHQTMIVGGPQWRGLVALLRDRCKAWGIPLDREHLIGHYQVANNRSDPGAQFPWAALMAEFAAPAPAKQEDDMRLLWNIDGGGLWLAGGFGAEWITDGKVAVELEKVYGAPVAVHRYTIDAIKAAAAA